MLEPIPKIPDSDHGLYIEDVDPFVIPEPLCKTQMENAVPTSCPLGALDGFVTNSIVPVTTTPGKDTLV